MNIKWLIYLSFLVLLSVGCSRKTVPKTTLNYSKSMAYKVLQDHNVDFDWWSAKGKVHVESPEESGGGKAYLRIQKDSVIWMAAKKIGIEGMRMLVQPDSFWVKFPIIKEYQRGRVDQFLNAYNLGVDYIDLQHLLAGNIMLPDTLETNFSQIGKDITMEYRDPYFYYKYKFAPHQKHLEQVLIEDARGRRILIQYDKFKEAKDSDIIVPHKRSLDIEGSANIMFDFSEIEINVPKKTRFSISNRYTEVRL